MQYLNPVGAGPSLNTCPRCELAFLPRTSVRCMPWALSTFSSIESFLSGLVKLGHPVPDLNLSFELKSGSPLMMQT